MLPPERQSVATRKATCRHSKGNMSLLERQYMVTQRDTASQVGAAAPVAASLAAGVAKEETLSQAYGGSGGDDSLSAQIYNTIGKVRIF